MKGWGTPPAGSPGAFPNGSTVYDLGLRLLLENPAVAHSVVPADLIGVCFASGADSHPLNVPVRWGQRQESKSTKSIFVTEVQIRQGE